MLPKSRNEAVEALASSLGEDELTEVAALHRETPCAPPVVMATLTARAGYSAAGWEPLLERCERAGIGADSLAPQRFVLASAAQVALDRLPDLPVCPRVRDLIYGEMHFVARPRRKWRGVLERPESLSFRSMCRILCLERFPAGQLHWEVSGFPLSWLRCVPIGRLVPTLRFILSKMRGVGPYFVTHAATRWTVPRVLLPQEEDRSYRLMAESMALQPRIRGTMSSSWLNDPALHALSDSLAWRLEKLRHGAFLTTVGRSPANAGFLAGDESRRALVESGKWTPSEAAILWPRRELLDWAGRCTIP